MRTFVTVHNADLIADCDRRFAGLDPTYLFVGRRPCPLAANVIHCASHPGNVEHLPQFYEYTGWVVLADLIRVGVITDDHLLLAHYDMRPAPDGAGGRRFTHLVTGVLDAAPGPISCEAGGRVDWFPPRDRSFEALYRSALTPLGVDVDALEVDAWPTTQGMAWRASEFVEFMAWFMPLFDAFKDHPLAGHLAERSIHAWCQTTGNPARIMRGLLDHEQADSHGTTALFYGDRRSHRAKAATFGR